MSDESSAVSVAASSAPDEADESGLGPSPELVARARELVGQMTLREKAAMASGHSKWTTAPVERLGIPEVVLADGPHGVRRVADTADGGLSGLPATCFPTASGLAATWDPAFIAEVGTAIAREARALGVDVVLGPGANLKRSPLCGRNFEYFSEDPFLSGRLAAALVDGIQAEGVGTSLKHFVANNQERLRRTIDAVIDERTLHELYLAGFEHVVRASQPWTMMSSYNRVNGTYVSDHHQLLTEVLRDTWGYTGLVMTDWGAMNDRVAAVAAGCDLEMPGPVKGAPERIVAAIESGVLAEEALDEVATRVTTLALRAVATRDPNAAVDFHDHHLLARRAAARVCVLLRNEGDVLPLDADGTDTVALLGDLAATPRFQGTGSSRITPTRVDDLRTELTAALGPDRVTFARGYDDHGTVDDTLIEKAVAVARGADVAVVVVGLPDVYENEGNDRADLSLPRAHDALVAAVAAAHDRVVVVAVNGAPVEMPWVDEVEAVLEGYLGGQAAGGGMADVLTGVASPGGRLAETFPRALRDVSSSNRFPGGPRTVEYREGVYVGYRFTESVGESGGPVLFPFGHGLGYAPVTWGDADLDTDRIDDEALAAGEVVTVTVPVTNDGDRPTVEVVQVYVRDVEAAVHRPDRELKGFARLELEPGETATATITLDRRAFAWWDVETSDWVVEGGTFEVLVAASARDVRDTLALEVSGAEVEARDTPAVYARPPVWLDVDRQAFRAVLGRPLPPNDGFSRPFDRNTPLGEVASVPQGRLLLSGVERALRAQFGDDPTAQPLVESMLNEAPVRTLEEMGMSVDQVDALLDLLNGEWGSGARAIYDQVTGALRGR